MTIRLKAWKRDRLSDASTKARRPTCDAQKLKRAQIYVLAGRAREGTISLHPLNRSRSRWLSARDRGVLGTSRGRQAPRQVDESRGIGKPPAIPPAQPSTTARSGWAWMRNGEVCPQRDLA